MVRGICYRLLDPCVPPILYGAWQKDVTAEELTAARDLELQLPAFDEFFIAYKDRSHLFAQGIDPLTIMSKNGISWPFYVRGGLIAGRAT